MAVTRSRGSIHGNRDRGGVAVRRPGHRHRRPVRPGAGRHGRLGEHVGLVRDRSAIRDGRALRRRRQLCRPARWHRPRHARSRHRAPQQPVLRAPRRPDPDGRRARAGDPRQPEGHARPRLLPHSVLFPVGHLVGRDRRAVALPVQRHRAGEQGAQLGLRSTDRTGSRTRVASSTSSSAPSASPPRTILSAARGSWGSPAGTGSPARRLP